MVAGMHEVNYIKTPPLTKKERRKGRDKLNEPFELH